MAIVDDHVAIAGEQQRIQAERQLERTEIVVPIGVLRVPTIRYLSRKTWADTAIEPTNATIAGAG